MEPLICYSLSIPLYKKFVRPADPTDIPIHRLVEHSGAITAYPVFAGSRHTYTRIE